MYIRVHVMPAAKREKFALRGGSTSDSPEFEIAVKEPAERNLANRRVAELVAAHFGASARIVSGHHSRTKVLDVAV